MDNDKSEPREPYVLMQICEDGMLHSEIRASAYHILCMANFLIREVEKVTHGTISINLIAESLIKMEKERNPEKEKRRKITDKILIFVLSIGLTATIINFFFITIFNSEWWTNLANGFLTICLLITIVARK